MDPSDKKHLYDEFDMFQERQETPQMIVTLPTGGGNFTFFLLGRQLRYAGTIVVILPLVPPSVSDLPLLLFLLRRYSTES